MGKKRYGPELDVDQYLRYHANLFEKLDEGNKESVRQLAKNIFYAYHKNSTVFICGNGGSGATASHMAQDLSKQTLAASDLNLDSRMKRLRVLSLTDNVPWIMAIANDIDYDRIFVEQLRNLASKDDLLIAISGSGNSQNIVSAVEWANREKIQNWGLVGFDGGELKKIVKNCIHVPCWDIAVVENIHHMLLHWIVDNVFANIHSSRT